MTLNSIYNRDFSSEFIFKAVRSSGPGGQHVNKVSSKIELRFSVVNSRFLSDYEKHLIINKLTGYMNQYGELIVSSQTHRSQSRNKEEAIEKFYSLIERALKRPKKRIATKPTKASNRKRLESKKKMADKKARRKWKE